MKKGILIVILLSFLFLMLTACANNASNEHNGSDAEDKNSENHQTKNDKDDNTYKVVIDPGHGGRDKGAKGADGNYEKEFTLKLGKKVESLLKNESNIKVFMTRDDDTFISQKSRYRPKYANKLNADIYVSIHGNTFKSPDVSGTQTFYYHRNDHPFAKIMQEHVEEATGFRDRGVKKKELFVLKDTNMPAALIEVGYLTNPQDEDKMFNNSFQKNIAESIVDGIKAYRDQSDK